MSSRNALEFWVGQGLEKVVFAPCRGGDIQSFYIFFPISDNDVKDDHIEESWYTPGNREQLLAPFLGLDKSLHALFRYGTRADIRPWRLFINNLYEYWSKGRTCIMGDAAQPMLPDHSQGACQAIEDAAALGIIFGPSYLYTSDVTSGLNLYEKVRKSRASKVRAASAWARETVSERIGFSSHKSSRCYSVSSEDQKLTIEEINGSAHQLEMRDCS